MITTSPCAAHRPGEDVQPDRVDAVVVGHQDAHGTERTHRCRRRPRSARRRRRAPARGAFGPTRRAIRTRRLATTVLPRDAYADDRAHVFHSWSAQGALDPLVVAGARGQLVLGRGRQPLPRLLQPAGQRQHRPPAPEARRRHQGAGRHAVHDRPVPRQRGAQRGGPAHRRAGRPATSTWCSSPTAAPRPPRTPMRMARLHTGRHKVLATYRSYHGATGGSITLTGDPRRWPSEPGMPGRRPLLGPVPVPLGVPRDRPRPRSASGRSQHLRRRAHGRGRRTPSPPSSSRPSSAPTASSSRRDGYLAGVRELCDQHGIVMIADEVMAGFGRCGEWFAVDHWDVAPDLICFAKGVNSRLRARSAAWSSAGTIADTFTRPRRTPAGSPTRGHPLACASAVAQHQHLQGGGHRRARPHARHRRHRPGAGEAAGQATRRSARCAASACSGPSSSCATARPASRSCRSTPPAPTPQPMAELVAACKAQGLWPFTHFNRIHVVPPCNTSDDDVRAGLAVIDEALDDRRRARHRLRRSAPPPRTRVA